MPICYTERKGMMRRVKTILVTGMLALLASSGCRKDELVTNPEIILPSVRTYDIEYITPRSAFCSGAVSSRGNSVLIEKGICCDDEPGPDTSDIRIASYPNSFDTYITGYTVLITDLVPNTTYYARSYVICRDGTVYGNELSFTTPADLSGEEGTVTDIEGNIYKTISIGTQVWTAENLKTTKFNDGTDIEEVTDATIWTFRCTPAYCWYDNDEEKYRDLYGAIYNFYVGHTGKVCPAGWHVPTDDDWTILESYLGGRDNAGKKLKEAGYEHWNGRYESNFHIATNESGFTALPGGERTPHGQFVDIKEQNFFWSSTGNGTGAWYRVQSVYGDFNFRGCLSIGYGGSLRCVKDQ